MTSSRFDEWLSAKGPVALAISEPLEPVSPEVDPAKRVFFPPTYADPGGDKKKPYYVIDESPSGPVCLIDSVASQANRMEPLFKGTTREELATLVPRVTVTAGDRVLSLLDLGHRAADAVIRFSDQGESLRKAFLDYRDKGDATALAKIAPTSLVFGAWDSRGDAQEARGTGIKIPRIVESTIRAYGAHRLTRAATYIAALNQEDQEKLKLQGSSEEGLANALAQGPGGVVATGGIKREAILNLIPLRALRAGTDKTATDRLQRYVLGLALVAFTSSSEAHLRQGCVLVSSETEPAKKQVVWRTGKRDVLQLEEDEAVKFALVAASEFKVGDPISAIFDGKRIKGKKKAESVAAAGGK